MRADTPPTSKDVSVHRNKQQWVLQFLWRRKQVSLSGSEMCLCENSLAYTVRPDDNDFYMEGGKERREKKEWVEERRGRERPHIN